jgi:hypothetical protein
MGALGSPSPLLSPRLRSPPVSHRAWRLRARPTVRISPPGQASGPRGRRNRHGNQRAAVRRSAQSPRALPYTRPRRRLRQQRPWCTDLPPRSHADRRRRAARGPARATPARAARDRRGRGDRRRRRRSVGRGIRSLGRPLSRCGPRARGARRSSRARTAGIGCDPDAPWVHRDVPLDAHDSASISTPPCMSPPAIAAGWPSSAATSAGRPSDSTGCAS